MLNPWNGKQLIDSNLTVSCMLIWEMAAMALDPPAFQSFLLLQNINISELRVNIILSCDNIDLLLLYFLPLIYVH